MDCTKRPQKRPPRESVLVVTHSDGWIEVYGPKHVDVRIVAAPHMTTPEGKCLAEEFLTGSLPLKYHHVYYPGNLRAFDVVRVVRPSDIAQRDWELNVLHSIDRASDILRGTGVPEMLTCRI